MVYGRAGIDDPTRSNDGIRIDRRLSKHYTAPSQANRAAYRRAGMDDARQGKALFGKFLKQSHPQLIIADCYY